MKNYSITRRKFLDESQLKKLEKVCIELSDVDLVKGRKTWVTRCALVRLALHSGLRVSEIAGLKIKDLHLNGSDPYLYVKGKGQKFRDVYVDRSLVSHLKKYLQFKKKSLKESVDLEAPLFAGQNGGHITATALYISFKQAIKKARLPQHFSIHSARHTYATYLLFKSKDLRFVQKQLGHSSLNMTVLYSDILPSQNSNLANKFLD